MWKDFPQRFCERHGLRGLVYSRFGYGRSTARPAGERFAVDFMHREAREALPALLDALGIEARTALRPQRRRLDRTARGRAPARAHRGRGGRRAALLRRADQRREHRARAPRLPRGRACASGLPSTTTMSIRPSGPGTMCGSIRPFATGNRGRLEAIRCPLLAVQGEDDEYGTLEQIHAIARRLPKTRLLALANAETHPTATSRRRSLTRPVFLAACGSLRRLRRQRPIVAGPLRRAGVLNQPRLPRGH